MIEEVRMVDISSKKEIYREAEATGRIRLKKETIERIKSRKVEKGNIKSSVQIASILAVKKTPELIPLCHPIPVTNVHTEVEVEDKEVIVKVRVKGVAKTGVEMEALVGVSIGLLTVWDMVKKYEKDEKGQYPETRITNLRVLSKIKREQEKDE